MILQETQHSRRGRKGQHRRTPPSEEDVVILSGVVPQKRLIVTETGGRVGSKPHIQQRSPNQAKKQDEKGDPEENQNESKPRATLPSRNIDTSARSLASRLGESSQGQTRDFLPQAQKTGSLSRQLHVGLNNQSSTIPEKTKQKNDFDGNGDDDDPKEPLQAQSSQKISIAGFLTDPPDFTEDEKRVMVALQERSSDFQIAKKLDLINREVREAVRSAGKKLHISSEDENIRGILAETAVQLGLADPPDFMDIRHQILDTNKSEVDILDLTPLGLTDEELAKKLNIAVGSVANYRGRLYKRLGVSCRDSRRFLDLAEAGIESGLLPEDTDLSLLTRRLYFPPPTEYEVLQLLHENLSYEDIAQKLGKPIRYVRSKVSELYRRYKVSSKAEDPRHELREKTMELGILEDKDIAEQKVESIVITDKESEALELLAEGLSNREIALVLQTSMGSVNGRLRRLYSRWDVPTYAFDSRLQLVNKGKELGCLSEEMDTTQLEFITKGYTIKELDYLKLLIVGMSTLQIASRLKAKKEVVKKRIDNICYKRGIKGEYDKRVLELVRQAREDGISLPERQDVLTPDLAKSPALSEDEKRIWSLMAQGYLTDDEIAFVMEKEVKYIADLRRSCSDRLHTGSSLKTLAYGFSNGWFDLDVLRQVHRLKLLKFADLSQKELDVLEVAAQGGRNREVADTLEERLLQSLSEGKREKVLKRKGKKTYAESVVIYSIKNACDKLGCERGMAIILYHLARKQSES